MYLSMLDDKELIAHLRATENELTRTDAERELLERFERLTAAAEETAPVVALLEEFDIDAQDIRNVFEAHPAEPEDLAAMLNALYEADIIDTDGISARIYVTNFVRRLADRRKTFDSLIELFDHPHISKE